MLTLRRAEQRGHANHGWLVSHHTFSFADYHDGNQMGFRDLRVLNDDRVAPHSGFGTHGHQNMEIITYVLSGQIEHKDSMGTHGILRPGDVQRMTAGTGVRHSEMNPGDDELHFLQIWVLPRTQRLEPSYEQKTFLPAERQGRLRLLVSDDGADGSLRVNQDVKLWATVLGGAEQVEHVLPPARYGWLQVARGTGSLNDIALKAGDGVAISDESRLVLRGTDAFEALLFDLA